MTSNREPLAFRIFWWTLGFGLLAMSLESILEANMLGTPPGKLHAILIGGVEALGAILFLIPKTMRVGTVLLLVAFLVAFVTHTTLRHVRWDLLIYAAAVFFVQTRGASVK